MPPDVALMPWETAERELRHTRSENRTKNRRTEEPHEKPQ